MTSTAEKIERTVEIDASASTVWRIVSEPGWWVNGGELVEHTIEDLGDGTCRVNDPTHGDFVITVVALEEPRYAAFRWRPTGPDDPSTLIEFFVEERAGGGVALRVVESGFEDLPADKLPGFLADNTAGWEAELALALAAALAG